MIRDNYSAGGYARDVRHRLQARAVEALRAVHPGVPFGARHAGSEARPGNASYKVTSTARINNRNRSRNWTYSEGHGSIPNRIHTAHSGQVR